MATVDDIIPSPPAKKCMIAGCPRDHFAKGYCKTHYYRKRNGWDMKPPVRTYTKDLVQLAAVRQPEEIATAVKARAAAEGVSTYEFVNRLVERWYRTEYQPPAPPAPKVAPAGPVAPAAPPKLRKRAAP